MLAAVITLLVAGSAALASPVEVEVKEVVLDAQSGSPVVQLREKREGGRELPIWIGPFEAQAIAVELHHVPAKRPQTHDLMKELVATLGGRVERVVIEDLREGTYLARLELAGQDGTPLRVDARPSDAIALAVRAKGAIFVEERVFERTALASPAPAATRVWGLTVQNLTPELAAVFGTAAEHGVLVADVSAGAPADGVVRGDVITALDGAAVESAVDLARRAGARAGPRPVSLVLEREGKRVTVTFPVP
jgi:hypothetical protein